MNVTRILKTIALADKVSIYPWCERDTKISRRFTTDTSHINIFHHFLFTQHTLRFLDKKKNHIFFFVGYGTFNLLSCNIRTSNSNQLWLTWLEASQILFLMVSFFSEDFFLFWSIFIGITPSSICIQFHWLDAFEWWCDVWSIRQVSTQNPCNFHS